MAKPAIRLPPLPTIRDLVKLYRIQAKKQLSQNFLMDERLTDKIVKQAGRLKDSQVVEVGPGPGGLTRSIIRRLPKKIVVVEKDKRFGPTLEMLSEAFATVDGKMDIIYDDILDTHLPSLISEDDKTDWENERCPNICIIGNLPFSLSTHLIVKWLKAISERSGPWSFGRTRMVLTFQKEVAVRLTAPPKHEQRCRLSVMAQAWTKPKLKFFIPGEAFVPKPKVDVGVVLFEPLIVPKTDHEFSFFEKITRHAFSFPRKYAIKSISTLFPPEDQEELSMMMFKLSDVDPRMRPRELTVEDVHRLCSAYKYLLEKHPNIRDYNYRAAKRIVSTKLTRNITVEDLDEDCEDGEDSDESNEDDRSSALN